MVGRELFTIGTRGYNCRVASQVHLE